MLYNIRVNQSLKKNFKNFFKKILPPLVESAEALNMKKELSNTDVIINYIRNHAKLLEDTITKK